MIFAWPKATEQNIEKLTRVKKLSKKHKFSPYFYGIDEPYTRKRQIKQRDLQRVADKAGVKTVTSLTTDAYDWFVQNSVQLEWWNFETSSGLSNIKKRAEFQIAEGNVATYYWQLYLEDMPRNRYYGGVYLVKSNMSGSLPFVYQAFHGTNPYLSDSRQLGGASWRKHVKYKAFNTTYPATPTPIWTIQWLAYREGIDDYRDAASTQGLLQEVNQTIINEAEKIQYNEIRPFQVNNTFLGKKLTSYRDKIINVICNLESQC
jgi:hypothetical protein